MSMDKATAEKMVNDLIRAYMKYLNTEEHGEAAENYVNDKTAMITALTTPPAKPQGKIAGFVQCQDKGWHKDMGDHYSSDCLTREAAIGDCTEAQLDELAEKSIPMFKAKMEKAITDHQSTGWTVIEALNKVSLISIMQQAATEAKPSINTSFYAMEVFAKAIRSHFAKAARVPPEAGDAEGLVRTMYAMLKTDEQLGAQIPKSSKGWMASAEIWIKSLHDANATERKPAKPLHDRLLEAAKAVLEWYNGERGRKGLNARLEAMSREIRAIEALEKGEG